MSDNTDTKNYQEDQNAMEFFLGLKRIYAGQRQAYEEKWRQAEAAVYMSNKMDKIYNGRAQINSPIMKWKVRGIVSRIIRILFNVMPFGRLEDRLINKEREPVVNLWNKYIFESQLEEISFKENFKHNQKNKAIYGTSIAKISQEFETREIDFYDDGEPEEFTIKDNTYYRPILITEFYSDIAKYNINESQACIQSTSVPLADLKANKKRTEVEQFELINQETGEVVGVEEKRKEVGMYRNLELLEGDGKNLTEEQERYLEDLGAVRAGGVKADFKKSLKDTKKTGFVQIDECYGKYLLDGEEEIEVICTIANGNIVIRLEETPFKHKRYVRPFIVGRYEPVPNMLYGESNVIAGHNLLLELNASRAQAADAKTRSVAPMLYEDTSKMVIWDKVWRPNGVIKGIGQNGITPIINPYLGNVTNQDNVMIQRDIDQLWSLSPVQEGTSDNRLIPSTASGTQEVIAQNDMPLNDIIDTTIEEEIKPFLEMLFERNITFKTVDDLLTVWTEEEIQKAGIDPNMDMRDLFFDFSIKILGNLELSNEIAHQRGYMAYLEYARTVPPLAKKLDWSKIGEKLLKSFGIKDDAADIHIDDEYILAAEKANQENQIAQSQAQEANRQKQRGENAEEYMFKKEVDTEAKVVEMQSEAVIEKNTGQKVQ